MISSRREKEGRKPEIQPRGNDGAVEENGRKIYTLLLVMDR